MFRVLLRRTVAIIVAGVLAGTMTTTASHAVADEPDPDPVVITADSLVFTLTTATGVEEVVSLDKFAAEVTRTPSLARRPLGGGASTNATSRIEGGWYKTANIFFNRDETNRIAVGAGVVYMLPASVPAPVVQAIRRLGGATVVWAGTAVAAGACVGIKTPISIGPRVPIPMYHRGGFCR